MSVHAGPYNHGIVTGGLQVFYDTSDNVCYSGTGTTLKDISRVNSTSCTLLNGVSYSGGDLVFDGLDDYGLINYTTALPTFTVEVWVYPTGFTGSACVISDSYPGTTSKINYCILANGSWRGGIYQAGWYYSPTMTQTLNAWQQVVFTFDGINQTIYKNAVSGGSTQTYSGSPLSSTAGIRLGRRWDLADYMAGKIGIVQIYDRPLSATEIEQNFNVHRDRFGL